MIRYLTQPYNSNICGPVAIINIMKFFDYKVTKKAMNFVKFKCNYDNGTEECGLNLALKDINALKFYIRKYPTIEQIKNHLNKEGAIIMLTYVQDKKELYGHYWVITAFNNKKYKSHNYRNKSTEYITEKELLTAINFISEEENAPKAWYISKRN